MSPTVEQEILRKLDRISIALFGVEGQENTSFINRTESTIEDHGKRLGKLERYAYKGLGAAGLVLLLVEIWHTVRH